MIMCARLVCRDVALSTPHPLHRHPENHLLLGEVLSFYLARLLGLGRVPPTALASPDHARWAAVTPQMEHAGWGAAPVVVLTPWLPDLVR